MAEPKNALPEPKGLKSQQWYRLSAWLRTHPDDTNPVQTLRVRDERQCYPIGFKPTVEDIREAQRLIKK